MILAESGKTQEEQPLVIFHPKKSPTIITNCFTPRTGQRSYVYLVVPYSQNVISPVPLRLSPLVMEHEPAVVRKV